jgi:hypothetical protein
MSVCLAVAIIYKSLFAQEKVRIRCRKYCYDTIIEHLCGYELHLPFSAEVEKECNSTPTNLLSKNLCVKYVLQPII